MPQAMLYPGFQGDLMAILAKHNMDALTNTSTAILAGMLTEHLEAYRTGTYACPVHDSASSTYHPWVGDGDTCGHPDCQHAPDGGNHPEAKRAD